MPLKLKSDELAWSGVEGVPAAAGGLAARQMTGTRGLSTPHRIFAFELFCDTYSLLLSFSEGFPSYVGIRRGLPVFLLTQPWRSGDGVSAVRYYEAALSHAKHLTSTLGHRRPASYVYMHSTV